MIELDLETVRATAKNLGVDYHPAMKAQTIQDLIDKKLADASDDTPPVIENETPAQSLDRQIKEATALIPVTVTSMDPQDASVTGVTISVGNRKIGQISKAIPFGYKWFMPKILLDEMETKMFVRSSMIPVPGGGERLNTQWIKKYAIQYHPMPSPAELAELAKLQLQGNELAK